VNRNHCNIFEFLSRRHETSPRRIVIRRRYLACVYFSWLSVFSSFYPQRSSPKWPATWTDARVVRPDYTDSDATRMISENSWGNAISRVAGRENNNNTEPRWPRTRKRFIVPVINVGSTYSNIHWNSKIWAQNI